MVYLVEFLTPVWFEDVGQDFLMETPLFSDLRSLAQDSPRLAALRARHWERIREELYTEELEAWGNRHPELR